MSQIQSHDTPLVIVHACLVPSRIIILTVVHSPCAADQRVNQSCNVISLGTSISLVDLFWPRSNKHHCSFLESLHFHAIQNPQRVISCLFGNCARHQKKSLAQWDYADMSLRESTMPFTTTAKHPWPKKEAATSIFFP